MKIQNQKVLSATALVAFLMVSPAAWSAPKAKKVASDAKVVTLDPKASSIAWTGKKLAGTHNGLIQLKSGQVEFKKGAPVGGSFEVDMGSITNTDLTDAGYNAKLVGHLKSDDFFGAEKHPVSTFKITGVKALKAAAGQPTHEISGDLTIKGKTQPVSFPAVVKMGGGKAEAQATVTLDRTRWDLQYNSGKFFDPKALGDKLIDDNFVLDLKLVGQAI
ncbi:MAG: YceI family protein [Oligoflexia bacterium]|nr:YceI family protein [Oligoflexia bacterium]